MHFGMATAQCRHGAHGVRPAVARPWPAAVRLRDPTTAPLAGGSRGKDEENDCAVGREKQHEDLACS